MPPGPLRPQFEQIPAPVCKQPPLPPAAGRSCLHYSNRAPISSIFPKREPTIPGRLSLKFTHRLSTSLVSSVNECCRNPLTQLREALGCRQSIPAVRPGCLGRSGRLVSAQHRDTYILDRPHRTTQHHTTHRVTRTHTHTHTTPHI